MEQGSCHSVVRIIGDVVVVKCHGGSFILGTTPVIYSLIKEKKKVYITFNIKEIINLHEKIYVEHETNHWWEQVLHLHQN